MGALKYRVPQWKTRFKPSCITKWTWWTWSQEHLTGTYFLTQPVDTVYLCIFPSQLTTKMHVNVYSHDSHLKVKNYRRCHSYCNWEYIYMSLYGVSVCLLQTWKDYQLNWDPADYGGIQVIRIKPDNVWKPDIVLFNKYVSNYFKHQCQVQCYRAILMPYIATTGQYVIQCNHRAIQCMNSAIRAICYTVQPQGNIL
jgi:hypothetical protein